MESYFGQLDFSLLCRLWRDHKELFQMVDFKDGKHAILKADFNERQTPDDKGRTHYLKASCKKSEQKEGLNYYLGNFKPSQQNNQQPASEQVQSNADVESELPF